MGKNVAPSLAGLRLGPPTGPMAIAGIPTYPGDEDDDRETNPNREQTAPRRGRPSLPGLVVYKPEEGNPVDPITQEPFTPGQMVYKTPEDGVNYDPHALYTLWSMNRAEGKATVDGTTKKVLPESEFDGLSEWVQKECKAPVAAAVANQADQVFKNPIVSGKKFVQREQPPVDPMEGMVPAERARLNPREWRHLNYADIDDLIESPAPIVRHRLLSNRNHPTVLAGCASVVLRESAPSRLLQRPADGRLGLREARLTFLGSSPTTYCQGAPKELWKGITSMSDGARGLRLWTTTLSFAQKMLRRVVDSLNPKNSSGPVSTRYCQSSRHKTSLAQSDR